MAGTDNQRIDGGRLARRIERLAEIGRREDGSCYRLALTDADQEGRDLVLGWMRALGLDIRIDRIGNIIGIRRGAEDLPPVMTGSHIDTVATGGRFDGCYGVLAGLEAVETLDEAGIVTRRPLAVAIFTNEEGVRFQPDMLGSLVHAGELPLEEALAIVGQDGATLGAELERIGYAGSEPPGAMTPHAYVELHIEQGPVLDRAGEALGAVAELQGISWQEVTLRGVSNHAGTTPMSLRHDAGYGAAALASFMRALAIEMGGTQVGTVGAIRLIPNLINVIARQAIVTVDLRNTDETLLREVEARLAAFLRRLAEDEGLTIETRRLARFAPVVFDPHVVGRIEAAAAALGQPIRRMVSGAGHDAQMLATVMPAGMLFVPSIGGISHHWTENTADADIVRGAQVFVEACRRLLARAV